MSAPLRLALFAVVLVVAGLVGAGLGVAVGPIDTGGGHDPVPATTGAGEPEPDHGGHGGAGAGHDLDEPFEVPVIGSEDGGS